jgi:hypothetical protein
MWKTGRLDPEEAAMENIRGKWRNRRRNRAGLILAVVGVVFLSGGRAATAQGLLQGGGRHSLTRGVPDLPPQGAWGEIIHATPRWLVLQNYAGQQFPIAVEDISDFLIRWPMTLDAVGPNSLVEAIGPDLGSNVLRTTHVDVFEGADRNMVAPTYNSVLPNGRMVTAVDPGFNRLMHAWDYAGQNMLYGWAFPVSPGMTGIPSQLHVVGVMVDDDPLRLSAPGNVVATVVPDASNRITVTQVTRGTTNYARKGDVAFIMPVQVTPRGLVVSQLVLHKTIPLRQFNPNR